MKRYSLAGLNTSVEATYNSSAMIYLLGLIVVFAVAYVSGTVDWQDFRGTDGKLVLPRNEALAKVAGWKVLERDEDLDVSWYSQEEDPSFLVGYDDRGTCAGVRAVFLKKDIDENHLEMYKLSKGIFKERNYLGQDCFYSTVLFSTPAILKHGGRRTLANDEVAMAVYLRQGEDDIHFKRDACDHLDDGKYTEQACLYKYGVIFSNFDQNSSCDSLTPFYGIYHNNETGSLLGFGWLSFSTFSKSDYKTPTNYKTLKESFSGLFPHSPPCLSTYALEKGLTSVEVWLSYEDSLTAKCPREGDWAGVHCRPKYSARPEDTWTFEEFLLNDPVSAAIYAGSR